MTAGEFGLRYLLQADPCQCPTCTTPTSSPSPRQRGSITAKAAQDRHSSADETDLRGDGGTE